jgi:hypothetical protein
MTGRERPWRSGAATANELGGAVVVGFPLRGEWVAVTTPAHRIPSHGTDMLGQRYAYDFVRTDRRAGVHLHPAGRIRAWLIGGRTRDCYGWGQPVHAATDGEVVAAVDGIAERGWLHVVREVPRAVKTAVTFDPRQGFASVAGNHVIVRDRNGSAFSAYAHLAPGSVAVRVGQQVTAGDEIGRVGHTGNSTAPHLHFQLMDGADPLTAAGVPCAFRRYEREDDGRWIAVERGVPRRRERIRSIDAT